MKLRRGELITISAVVLAAVLSVFGHIVVREWYRADLRYETGEYYRTSTSWITALRIENYGREAAEGVIISASFPMPIREYSVGTPGMALESRWEGPGSRTLSLETRSIAPGQSFYSYFDVEPPPDGRDRPLDYVNSIVSSAGVAEEGAPRPNALLLMTFSLFVGAFGGGLVSIVASRPIRTKIEEVDSQMDAMESWAKAMTFGHEMFGEVIAYAESLQESGQEVPDDLMEILRRYRQPEAACESWSRSSAVVVHATNPRPMWTWWLFVTRYRHSNEALKLSRRFAPRSLTPVRYEALQEVVTR